MEKFRPEKRKEFLEMYVAQHEIGGKLTDTIDVPPGQPSEKSPVLLAPGWASTIPVYQPSFRTLAQEGRRVLSLNHPQTATEMCFSEEELKRVADFPREELQKASNLLELIHIKEASGMTEKVDIIAHSEGSINSIIAALARPEKIGNIVLFAPPGFMGEDSRIHLGLSWAKWQIAGRKGMPTLNEIPVTEEQKEAARAEGRIAIEYPEIPETDESRDTGAVAGKEGIKYLVANPVRMLKEYLNMPSVQLDEVIQKLRKQGIGIVIMSGVDDPLFPTEKMATYLKKDMVDGFLAVRGSHAQIGEAPERYVVAAEQMLTALKEKKAKAEAKKLNGPRADTSAE